MLVLDSIEQVEVSSLMIVNNLPTQVPVRNMGHESTPEINSLLVDSGDWNFMVIIRPYSCLKRHLNASRPSEHPPVRGKMSKRLGGIIGSKCKTSTSHLNGFPDGLLLLLGW